MTNEMDIMRMDAPRRSAWLRANRVTLMTVGIVWIGMIAVRLSRGEDARFLLLMVPVFALIRLAAYVYNIKRSRHRAAAKIDAGEPPSQQHGWHQATADPAASYGRMARRQTPDAPDATGPSFSLLLP